MVRRALTRGFWQAYSLSLGACSGDFLWALGVALGAGALIDIPGVRAVLGVVSTGLLLIIAWIYLRGAWTSYMAGREKPGAPLPAAPSMNAQSAAGAQSATGATGVTDSARRGYALGFMMALTSPWNIAFWLAVIGQGALDREAIGSSLALALAVVGGSAAWGLTLCAAVRLGARFATPRWDIGTRAATGALMLGFAARSIWRLILP